MKLFDSHAHLNDDRFDDDRAQVIAGFAEKGVVGIIECATDPSDLEVAVNLANAYEPVYAAVGVHPHSAKEYDVAVSEKLRALAKEAKVVAVGEIGLDYHYDFSPRDVQKDVLFRQIELAKELNLPVILHSRESTADMLEVLKAAGADNGVMHCFSGSVDTAKVLLDMGLYLGVGGTLTFKNAVKAIDVVRMTPIDRILIETDSPYLAPIPMRGKRNEPAYVEFVARKIAEIKEISEEEVAKITFENARRLFGI